MKPCCVLVCVLLCFAGCSTVKAMNAVMAPGNLAGVIRNNYVGPEKREPLPPGTPRGYVELHLEKAAIGKALPRGLLAVIWNVDGPVPFPLGGTFAGGRGKVRIEDTPGEHKYCIRTNTKDPSKPEGPTTITFIPITGKEAPRPESNDHFINLTIQQDMVIPVNVVVDVKSMTRMSGWNNEVEYDLEITLDAEPPRTLSQ